jgi:hypothetical protein
VTRARFAVGDRVYFPANGRASVDDTGAVVWLAGTIGVMVRWDNGEHDCPEDAPDGQPAEWFRPDDLLPVPTHAGYPHLPGRLPGCPACESGPCRCDPATDAPCVSDFCELAA